jgi:hypothetical protein
MRSARGAAYKAGFGGMESAMLDERHPMALYRARAKYAEEQALASATPNGREIWLHIALQYRILAGFAGRLRNDGL